MTTETTFGWDKQRDSILSKHWGKKSAQCIADILGTTKNSVIGRARRIGLKKLQSGRNVRNPIHREPVKKQPIVVEKTKSERVRHYVPMNNLDPGCGCKWPFGNPKRKDFHFCGKKRVKDKPYCEEHCAVSFVKPKD